MTSIPQAPPIPNAVPPSGPPNPGNPGTPAPINPFEKPIEPASAPKEGKSPVNPFKSAKTSISSLKGSLEGKHKKINAIAKYASITLVTIFLVGLISTQAVMDESNSYLGLFGVVENTAQKNQRLKTEASMLINANTELEDINKRIQDQIDSDNFFVYADMIDSIREKQRVWSDTITPEGSPQFGLLDLPEHIANYFNNGKHEHDVLFSNGSTISIKNFTIERDRTTFTIYASNFFGNVFLLSSEITKIINGLPEFKNGKILSYSRVNERSGNHAMSFTLTVENQEAVLSPDQEEVPDKADNNDSSANFQNWFRENAEIVQESLAFEEFGDEAEATDEKEETKKDSDKESESDKSSKSKKSTK